MLLLEKPLCQVLFAGLKALFRQGQPEDGAGELGTSTTPSHRGARATAGAFRVRPGSRFWCPQQV